MLCQHEKYKIIIIKENVKVCKCDFCNLIFASKEKRQDLDEIYGNYYKKETGGRFNFGIEYIVKFFRFLRALKIFLLRPKSKSIFDIGSGRGWMLYFLKKYFKYEKAIGTQISQNAYEFSKEKLGLEIYNKDLLDLNLGGNKFDIITLWHVLEHISDPEAYIQRIGELLSNNGLVLIEVPNFNSWSRMLAKNYWLALNLKHHLFFFTPDLLKIILEKYNFRIKKTNTFSLEYSTFTSTQSIVNLVTNSDDCFFQWLQEGKLNFRIIFHSLFFVILFPVCFLINMFLYFSKNGEVINIIAEKNGK